MNDVPEVICRPRRQRALWFLVGLGAAGSGLAAVRLAYRGELLDVWLLPGPVLAPLGLWALHAVVARVSADAYGVHVRTLLRRRSVPWSEVADLRVRLKYENNHRVEDARGVVLALHGGRRRNLPLPTGFAHDDRPDFDAKVDALRALHRRHGHPESSHLPVISRRTAGRGWLGSLAACAVLLVAAAVTASTVPGDASEERAWRSAVPCAATTPAGERGECLTVLRAVIERTDANRPKENSWLYFTDGRPMRQLGVSYEAATAFQPGDGVELTVWRRTVMVVAGERHVWRRHISDARETAVVAAVFALGAGYPAARVLMRLRGRRLPDDEVLPSTLPFVGVLVATAVWLLPLCYVHPTTLLTSPVAVIWAAAGSLATLGLSVLAWRATGTRPPGGDGKTEEPSQENEVFLAARFLEHTDYNPHGFGTHVVLGDGPPAVTPHAGPGRFAAKPLPVDRLTFRNVRRARGSDADTVPSGWHIAELDDAGRPVRLAAAPADLTRIIRALPPATPPDDPTDTASSRP
ncbi:PH domain-containing protein [Streptomyces sp. TG1A-60]|uniref:PH domain-containing protein n=1 Tax=Streptomyces sp. TG1A-60 TaxID=3129111 RepID=UPI0030CA7E59